MTTLPAWLNALHTDGGTAPPASLAEWRRGFAPGADSFAAAVAAGARAGQLAFAFAAGYQCALRRLLPALPPTAFAALLVSEGKRQRPEELLTTLTPLADGNWRLDGEKSYVAGGDAADPLLVLARAGTAPDGRVLSRLVSLPATQPGIVLAQRGDTGFLTALPHARATFSGVVVMPAQLLPGDGWRDYARPFRTLEDIHVTAALAAHIAAQGLRAGWPPAVMATLVAVIDRLGYVASLPADDAWAHLLLAAVEREMAQVGGDVEAALAGRDDPFARDWRANRMLLALAAPARMKRLEKAAQVLRP